MKKILNEKALSVSFGMLAQWGSKVNDDARKEKGMEPEEPTEIWVECNGQWPYLVIPIHCGICGAGSADGPPPSGAFVLRVTRQP